MTTDAPAELRPPPEYAHLRWHWICSERKYYEVWEWYERGKWAVPGLLALQLPSWAIGWSYHAPCVPLIADDATVERVARAICVSQKRDPDASLWLNAAGVKSGRRWHANIDAARAVIDALQKGASDV